VVRTYHTNSRLLKEVEQSTIDITQAQEEVLAIIREHCQPKLSPLCGNSIWQDAAFLRRYMPKIMDFLHYRIIDVSSFKEIITRWYGDDHSAVFVKKETHRALEDIQESIAELAYYRQRFLK